MKNKEEYWVTSALTNDNIVADFLVRIKQLHPSSSSQPSTSKTTTTTWLSPMRWGHRKSRSKPPSIVNNNTAAIKQQQQSGSPTTPLCWSGGAGTSTDGYDESSRSGDRSNKGALANEGATTSGYKKSRKRKSFAELKEEEDFLLKERQQLNRELESMRVTMSTQIATSQNLKKFKVFSLLLECWY
ncbi:hypothetical protein CTI12_AA203270 [Artemisia annua]|uniref:Uncharacterized protein n=1 Tax=Artemisia annua TaxID=35608 RepID=A0A2U1P1P2_ARTAN|nr:hypothetical protein CTI12_AA203270 [Artemisia annua]